MGNLTMQQLILKYRNELNTVSFNGFNAVDQNLFMAICARMKEKGEQKITFKFSEIRKIINYPEKKTDRDLEEDLRHMNRQMLKLTCGFVAEGREIDFVLFPTFERDYNKKTLTIAVNPPFAFLINDFTGGGYTQLELNKLISLKSKYTKTIYRYLRQYRTTGWWQVSIEEFRENLCIPKSYLASNIQKRILDPAIEELKGEFKDLAIEPIYKPLQGAPIAGYKFTWTPKDEIPGQMSLTELSHTNHNSSKKFHNFSERDNDWSAIEKRLLERQNEVREDG